MIKNIILIATARDGGSKLIEVEYDTAPFKVKCFVDHGIGSKTAGEIFYGSDRNAPMLNPDARNEIRMEMYNRHIL